MAFICKLANHLLMKVVSDVSRVVAFLLFLAYFAKSQVRCDEEIQFCKNALKKLQNNDKIVKDWSERCLQRDGHMLDSPCCETERKYLRARKCDMHSRMCSVYKGPYSEPYLLVRSSSAITAIDLKTLNKTFVVSGLGGAAMDIDTVEKRLYFQDGNSISKLNLDANICPEVIVKNAAARDLAIDWWGRRIFWTEYSKKRIFEANLNGTIRHVLVNTTGKPYGIAIDAIKRYVFWTEPHEGFVQRINLVTNEAFTLVRNSPSFAIVCVKRRVYWLEQKSGTNRIFSIRNEGGSQTLIATGFFDKDLLGVFGNLLYFLDSNSTSLNEMNISSKNIKRKVSLVQRHPYLSMTIVDSSLKVRGRDFRGIFLRHTLTGKCIAASDELVYDAPSYSLPYFVKMTDNCLDENAQFRYLDSKLLHNIEKEGTLVSAPSLHHEYRWAVYKGVAAVGKRYQQSADHRLKQTAAECLAFYSINNPICAEPDSSNYVLRKTSCCTTQQKFTFGAVTAYNAKMENVHCSPIQRMMVKSADYGSFDKSGMFDPNANIDSQCSKLTNCQVKSRCDGNRSCELTIDNILLPSQYCSDTSKHIYTKYTCVDEFSNIKTEADIALQEVYKGYLKVKDVSTWRSVTVSTTWDKNQEKMLCQYLGFMSTEEPVRFQTINKGNKIASGDLVCYVTNANRISCCVHLNPSTAGGQERSPYVECKLCDTPILTAKKKFSNQIFSGHRSSDYQKANFSKSGWCSSMPGSYLLLDLQKEYHLTHVVVMADKNQTKWSSSYSMQYSHSNTSVDSSYETQIKGNDNGYQASNTKLTAVYNARYIKIKSTAPGNTDFCMRIEFCGTVQMPAPVYDITITPSVTRANVTWKLQTSAADSSYITHLIIHVGGKENHTIVKRGNQFTVTGLKRHTKYSVGIQTQDGSLQRSKKVFETFTTLTEEGDSGKNEEKKSSGNVGIVVGASLVVIVIVVSLILAVVFLRRRARKTPNN